MPFSRRALVGLALTAPVLAACGASEAPTVSGGSPSAAAGSPTATSDAAGMIRVIDSRGVTVTLERPATRVVTLEWGPTEDVLALGVEPVAVADPAGFASYVSSVTLPEGTPDVGLRTEPSLESIAAAEPDLILGVNGSIPENAIAQAEQIAPVVLLTGADATRQLENLRDNFNTVALLLGREAAAQEVLSQLDAKLEESAAALSGVTAPYIFAWINVTGSTADLRMHSSRSVPGAIAEELGLTNAYTEPGDDAWGIGSWDLEALTTLPADTQILSWANDDADPLAALAGNPLWDGLAPVQAGNVHPAALHIWVYGGPMSMMQWADDLVAQLA
ncbi:iron-siderophore ABC transporter substrate-binding protein [Propioniciclava soli]|uniref:Iron-siderophore ABC transporter substrate-binding protein n=1 Tax=Propioniciclava soli TaxID=2775081 RepID=A0ABZ3C5F8_9ACTN|nr:iron-siderophore ABC transporter substrate-binding protein [Propioniciclava soli]